MSLNYLLQCTRSLREVLVGNRLFGCALIVLIVLSAGCSKRDVQPTATADQQPAADNITANEPTDGTQDTIVFFKPEGDVQTAIQEELILAEPGSTIQLEEGVFEFTAGLSLDVDDVTIRGRGADKTILSFKGQEAGAEGLYVTSDRVLIEDLAIVDTKGNGMKSHTANDTVVRRVRVEWTGGPKTTNGAYGIYPVNSTNVLVEDCTAIGASDAGIYVGQSKNIMIRNCLAKYNVPGIEIENCYGGEAYNNTTTNNTGGILVFDLPDLPMQRGHDIRVHHNKVFDNNTPNFAPKGNIVGTVAAGTGLMIMANDNVEVFENDIRDHDTVNCLVISYLLSGLAINDPNYYPYPERVHIHHNTFGRGGDKPSGEGGQFMAGVLGAPLPDILWDGVMDIEKYRDKPIDLAQIVCVRDNQKEGGELTFANLGGAATLADPSKAEVLRDLSAHTGLLPAVKPVVIEGVDK